MLRFFMKTKLSFLLIGISFIAACNKKNKIATVTTFAGSGVMGSADGKGVNATFANMMGLTTDANDNIYVADSHNNIIRKISPDGVVTTFAGNGTAGTKDGKGVAASFFNPAAITADKKGNVYVADTQNNLIRKITPAGSVSTIAGKWQAGLKIGTGGVFDNPAGLAVDATGNVYVADRFHDKICKISPDGKITTIAGSGDPGSQDGAGTSASFYVPQGIAIDSTGNLYVADTYNNLIRKITPAGVVTTIAGKTKKKGKANGKGAAASFSHPYGIAVDKAGNIYVADQGNNLVRKITPEGIVTTFAGNGIRGATDGNVKEASFYKPMGVTLDKQGNVYIADYQNNLIRRISN